MEVDPLRGALIACWESCLRGNLAVAELGRWARDQLFACEWDEEVVHMGLQAMNDESRMPDFIEDRAAAWRRYRRWREVVQRYDDDPAGWNREYLRSLLARLIDGAPEESAQRFADAMRLAGLADSDIDELMGQHSRCDSLD